MAHTLGGDYRESEIRYKIKNRRTVLAARLFFKKIREALNKSRHASCLHIFRLIARKLLEIHQVFLRHFHAIGRKICLRNLHTRFNQHFLRNNALFIRAMSHNY